MLKIKDFLSFPSERACANKCAKPEAVKDAFLTPAGASYVENKRLPASNLPMERTMCNSGGFAQSVETSKKKIFSRKLFCTPELHMVSGKI